MSETGDPKGVNSISIEKLTPADLPRTVIHLAWPVVLEMTFFGLGGIINTILVGRLGASALTAVGLGQQIEFMIQVAFAAVTASIGLCSGPRTSFWLYWSMGNGCIGHQCVRNLHLVAFFQRGLENNIIRAII